jgi:rare lipoprotein A (peptidoglycan hydrolase)
MADRSLMMKALNIRDFRRLFVVLALGALAACTERPMPPPTPVTALPEPAPQAPAQPYFSQTGVASWYGGFHHGRKTASGERFDMHALTAAHRTLQLGTVVRITNIENGRTATVRVNDRGPYKRGRVIDLSAEVARQLDMKKDGLAEVRIEAFAADQTPEVLAAAGQTPPAPDDPQQ